MNKLDINSWIANHFRLEDFEERLKSTNNSLEFLWIWTIFEREIISKGVALKEGNMEERIIYSLRETRIECIGVESHIEFFRKRYFDQNDRPTKYLKSLNFSSKYFNDLKCTLLKEECSNEIRIRTLVLIAYRFRCNLFHGGKDPLLWHSFEDVFLMIIHLLMLVIDNQQKPYA